MSSSRRSSAATSTWDRLAGLGEQKLAELDAGAGHQVRAPVRRQRRQAQRVQAPYKVVDHVVGDIQNGQRTPRRHHRKTSRCGGGGVRKTRMAWTADRDRAEWFQHRYEHTDKPGKLWTITSVPIACPRTITRGTEAKTSMSSTPPASDRRRFDNGGLRQVRRTRRLAPPRAPRHPYRTQARRLGRPHPAGWPEGQIAAALAEAVLRGVPMP
jgi:hypothetical protein